MEFLETRNNFQILIESSRWSDCGPPMGKPKVFHDLGIETIELLENVKRMINKRIDNKEINEDEARIIWNDVLCSNNIREDWI